MNSATKITVSTFGVIAAAAGIEHGAGEVLQGSRAPESMFILSWPGSEFFSIMNGEPAMTIVPNLLASGILAILASLVFLAWALFFVERKGGGLALIGLSIVMLLVGGGFGPPLLGILLGAASARLQRTSATTPHPAGAQGLAGQLWKWLYAAALAAWLLLMPGLNLIDYFIGLNDPTLLMTVVPLSAFGLLVLALASAAAKDRGLTADL